MSQETNIISGKQAVKEFIARSPQQIEVIFFQEDKRNLGPLVRICQENKIKFQYVPKQKLDRLTKIPHQGILAKIFPIGFYDESSILDRLSKAKLPLLVALDQVQDSGNLGALARTLYAAGGAGLVITKNRSASLGPRAYKSSAGALSKLPISRITNLARFLKFCQGRINRYYAGLDESCLNAFEVDINWPAILVLGNEEKGVRPGVKKYCDHGLNIPMFNSFDSLNVAQAGCIFIGELLRQWLVKNK